MPLRLGDKNKAISLLKLAQSVLSLLVIIRILKKKKKRLRRWWVKPHLYPNVRNILGAYSVVCLTFQLEDHEEFRKFLRMDVDDFEYLYNLVKDRLQKQFNRRQPINSGVRLAATLHYLGHRGSISSNALLFRVGRSTLQNIIYETCKVLISILTPIYAIFPNAEEWLRIADDFKDMWQFPNCLGALDGTHIRIQRPAGGGSMFFNYKRFHSLVLMALSDAHSRFIWFSIGDCGSYSDSSVFAACDLSYKLQNNLLNIPNAKPLPNTEIVMPFVIVADEIFPLWYNLMKPYSRRLIRDNQERVYNYRLSRARFTIECAFGILRSKWQILKSALNFDLECINAVVGACICLHNMLITRNKRNLNNNAHLEDRIQGAVRDEIRREAPVIIRDRFAQYFNSNEGSVPWQHLCI